MMNKPILAGVLGVSLASLSAAHAQLAITNGDFETGGGANIADVFEWFDSNTGGFFEGAWHSNSQSFNETSQVVFSSFEADDFGTPTPDVNDGCYLYQGIGTADGVTELSIQFDWGSPTDDAVARNLGITVGVYAYDGVGTFTPGDDVDVRGGDGVTLLDSVTFTSAPNTRPAGGTMFVATVADLDISGAGTQELFLRFNGYLPGATESWPTLDNVVIVPDAPIFVTQPEDTTGFIAGEVTLMGVAAASPAASYQWEYSETGSDPWTVIEGATSSMLVISPVSLDDIGYYRVKADNGTEAISDEVFLDVFYPDPTITSQPASAAARPGEDVTFTVEAEGLGNLSYQWFGLDGGLLSDGGSISGVTTKSLTVSNVQESDIDTFYCEIVDDQAAQDGLPGEEGFILTNDVTFSIVEVVVTSGMAAPATDPADQFHLPGNVEEADAIGGTGAASGDNDASTYFAFDKESKGMTFTTGPATGGYDIHSVTLQHVLWDTFLANGTFYNIPGGALIAFEFGSISGPTKTPIYSTEAGYSGATLNGAADSGTGTFLTFDLADAGIGSLAPNTTYYFEVAVDAASGAYFELKSTSGNEYPGGQGFRGDDMGAIDGDNAVNLLAGDFAFHVDLESLGGGGDSYADWIALFPGVGAMTGFDDDPDRDGLANGVENFLGTDPSQSSAGLAGVSASGSTFTFTHPQNPAPASDVSAVYTWSLDLDGWNASGASEAGTTVSIVASPDTPEAGTTTVTATISGTVPDALQVRAEVSQD